MKQLLLARQDAAYTVRFEFRIGSCHDPRTSADGELDCAISTILVT
jgi:hypothetical protein